MRAKRIRYLDALLAAVSWADKIWRVGARAEAKLR